MWMELGFCNFDDQRDEHSARAVRHDQEKKLQQAAIYSKYTQYHSVKSRRGLINGCHL